MAERGAIAGINLDERLVNLAGWIAERGVPELDVWAKGRVVRLCARETDLPGWLRSRLLEAPSAAVEIDDPSGAFRVRLTRDACEWFSSVRKPGAENADNPRMTTLNTAAPSVATPCEGPSRLTIVHVTHEAVVHMGGIGTVLQGLLTSPVYQDAVRRSLLVGPLWNTAPVAEAADRLGGDGSRVIYSSLDRIDERGLAAKLRPIELAFGVGVIYGVRTFRDENDPGRVAEAETLLFDLHAADHRRVNEFKAVLFERFGIESHVFDGNQDFEQWVRLAQPAYAALAALTNDDELPGVLISHEYMGMPTALWATLDRATRFRTIFHGHECSTARAVVEHHPGHDSAFYPEMRRARAQGRTIEFVFGSQANNYRHQLVSRAHELDLVLAVGDDTAQELRFLSEPMSRADIRLCYNGAPNPEGGVEEKLASRRLILDWLEPIVGFRPDVLLTHVTRPVISKGLWRDLMVGAELDRHLAAQGRRAVYLLLTCGAQPRSFDEVTRMAREYGWPAVHREGSPDLAGPEIELGREIDRFNRTAGAIRAVLVNQFGFSRESLGEAAPASIGLSDLRRAADAEFGLSVYEPFGIAPVEPLYAGAISVVTRLSGCAGFMLRAATELGLSEAERQNFLIADFSDEESPAAHDVTAERRRAIEQEVCRRVAIQLAERLPVSTAERAACFATGQRLANAMGWDRVCRDELLPAIRSAMATTPAP